ncbi:MAG TPA: C40 family peptidase [Burkholderiales bacterium]|nr:C40 family peptidase [Burkholderiales bacterium]
MKAPLLTCLLLALTLAGCAGAQVEPDVASVRSVPKEEAAQAADAALAQLGRPYRYGGDSPAGFDCSGLVRFSYLQVGVQVSRETRTLRTQARLIRAADLQRGDLVFFDQEGKKFSHVGIYLGDGRFVHAPSSGGRVRTDRLDSDYWKRHFVEARRI